MKSFTFFKKIFALALLVVLGQSAASAASKLYFSDLTIAADGEQEIQLFFDTDADDIKNIDATITLPDGLSFVDYGNNTYAKLNDERLSGMASFNYATGSLKIKGVGDVIAKGEGAIATFKVKAAVTTAAIRYITVTDAVITHNDKTTENLENTSAMVTVENIDNPDPQQVDFALAFDADEVVLAAGEEVAVNVSLKGTQTITMLSAVLTLPEGVTATVAKGERLSSKPNYIAANGQIAITSGINDGEGSLFVINLKADDTFAADGVLSLTKIVGTTKAAQRFEANDLTLAVTLKKDEPSQVTTTTIIYALEEGDEFKSGDVVEVKDGENVVATITYGEAGGADFKAAKADGSVDGFTAFTEGNGTNGNKEGGTFYTIKPEKDGIIEVAVVLNADKAFYIEEDGTALPDYDGIKMAEKVYKTFEFEAKAGKSYKVYCAGSKLGFYGFKYTFEEEVATAITTVTVEKQAEGIFTLAGQRVNAATKGLYIINGKKVLVK